MIQCAAVSDEYDQRRIQSTIDMAHSFGVTAVIEPGMDEALLRPLLGLSDAGKFDLRAKISLSRINWQPGAFDDSDYFATRMNPLLAIEVGITRQDPHSNEGPIWNATERVDLVVRNKNLFAPDHFEISDAYVTMMIFNGRTVYQHNE